jgi:hypothetical protein
MLWADDEFGFDFAYALIVAALAAVVGLAFLIRWLLCWARHLYRYKRTRGLRW